MKLIIFGPPGAGKGTQAKLISKKFKLKHISAGEIIRREEVKKSKLGLALAKYVDMGKLAPYKIVDRIVEKRLPKDNYILDGFPRSVEQAKEISKIIKIDLIININIEKEIIIKRLLRRAKIEGRKDDTPEIIKNRFEVYEKQTKPVLNYFYKNKYNILHVNGNSTPEKIFKEVYKVLKDWKENK